MKSKGAIVLVSKDEVDVGKDLKIDTILISKTETKLLHFQKVVLDYKGLLEVCIFDCSVFCFFLKISEKEFRGTSRSMHIIFPITVKLHLACILML